jgi:23S rRNA (adenine-N6)-dimethyltransferase
VRGLPNVEVVVADARTHPLPSEPFRVVASLPFGSTTAILRRLLDDPTVPMRRADVVVQLEVARKRTAAGPGTLLSAYWGAWFEFTLGARLPAACFRPPPAVDAAVLTITRRRRPLVPVSDRHRYLALIRAGFERANLPLDRALGGRLDAPGRRRLRRELPILAGSPAPALTPADWAALLAACSGQRVVQRAAGYSDAPSERNQTRHSKRGAG